MTALALALLLSQLPTPFVVKDEGVPKGPATSVNCTGTGVTCSLGLGGVWTLNATGGGAGATPGGSSGNLQVNDGAGGFGAYTGTGAAPSNQWLRTLDANGAGTWSSVRLNQLGQPSGDVDFAWPAGDKILFTFTGSTDEAFTIHGDGSFTGTGDLLHVHKTGTGSAAGADALHVEVDSDLNMTGLRITMANGTRTALSTNALISAAGFSGPLTGSVTGNAGTATALAADPANCSAGQAPLGITATGAVEGCFTPAGTYTLPAASTTLGGVKMAAACGAGNHVSSIGAGGELTCSADSGGGGGSPGGSTTQVQYNNAGAFGGMSRVTTDGADLILTGSTTEPTAPAAGYTKLYGAQPHGSGGPVLPFWKGGTTQVDYRLFPEMRSADPVWGCLQPGAHGSTTITPAGSIIAGTATGTAASVAWAATDERTRAKWVQYPTTAAVNLNAGLRANVDYVWRGNAAGIGGFYVWGTFNIVTANAGQRVFFGLKDATAVLTAASDPSAALDSVYFGANSADTNLSICSNDNSGTATCTTLGANFPKATANTAYDWALWAQPNGSSIGYYIRRLVNGSEAQGTISSDLPRNTVALGWDMTINSGTSAAITTMQFGGVCYIANP